MGNRNLYHFCLAVLVLLDVAVPLALLAAAAASGLRAALSFFRASAPGSPGQAPDKGRAGPAAFAPPALATNIFIGRA